ncbi:MAG: 30S ribosomal protein S3 [bacterium]|nr:30S ribosomal protein S3 [bacterium]
MGQKVNPIGFRLGILYSWQSRWFADGKRYTTLLLEDNKIRKFLGEKLKNAGLARVEIERSINKLDIIIFSSRPGIIIGRGGTGLEDLKKQLEKIFLKEKSITKINLSVEAVKEPNLDAFLMATNIAEQLAKRLPHKRVIRMAAEKIMEAGAKGMRIKLSGRIAGAEISRTEKIQKGALSLGTLREKVDYASVPSLTRSGYIGVKVWICKK